MRVARQDSLRFLCWFPHRSPMACVYAGPTGSKFFCGNYSLLVSLKQGFCWAAEPEST